MRGKSPPIGIAATPPEPAVPSTKARRFTALASSLSQNIGGRATKASKAEQEKWGLRDKAGNFLDSRLAMTDPDKWAWEKLMPALERKGVDINDNVKVSEVLSKLFSNRVVGDLFSKLITQREQYQAKAEQYGRAPGLAGAAGLAGKDPLSLTRASSPSCAILQRSLQ
jgi:hypothetical protein